MVLFHSLLFFAYGSYFADNNEKETFGKYFLKKA